MISTVRSESGRKPDPSGVYKVAVCLTRHKVAPLSARHSFDFDDEQEHSVVIAAAETTTTKRKPALTRSASMIGISLGR